MNGPLFEYLLRLGDDRLVLGHRLSEWCGHGPVLEEDIALANLALDLLGQASIFLRLAGRLEGRGRDEDALAYWRDEHEFRNLQLCELPKGDFAFTLMRQLLFDAWSLQLLDALTRSSHAELAAIAAKALKETRYHLRHSNEWVLRLGDGTPESHARAQAALDELWPWTGELSYQNEVDAALQAEGIVPQLEPLRAPWEVLLRDILTRATLTIPPGPPRMTGGRFGRHSEHLGHLLAELQIVARSHPGAKW
ncbi:MAG TPA: 1,2-phenylacetyl-CoA epoxidase subunit PaaC [Gemmatimonadales bacterium]|jgi:ring-1,2-phenylacetyl-CoA epoxidase subunit PaaC|nr:1,2-phenylacetyl-CoA epoxidase subunit PaaC [Gemmatimonadales bacterium]